MWRTAPARQLASSASSASPAWMAWSAVARRRASQNCAAAALAKTPGLRLRPALAAAPPRFGDLFRCVSHQQAAIRGFCAQASAESAAAQGGAETKVSGEEALLQFRKRASAELAGAEATVGAPAEVAARLRAMADEESSGATSSSPIAAELEGALTSLDALGALRREQKDLRAKRADLLAVGFQSQSAENQEFAALVVCATAGIFAVSIHYGFFVIWGFAYMVYRKATQQTRIQRASSDDLQGIVERLRELDALEATQRSQLQALAEAWRQGQGHQAAAAP
eukprot:TRINITY_DN29300_c0_g1_i1.p2 TRINITY_DN29300_c0_g1~~TRINITY_DN29300_c0_g1_i1.p2  ORF type:complete len:282 (+),score=74.75 TRINITY_DN29300_c0_g1_i1:71-916(+)